MLVAKVIVDVPLMQTDKPFSYAVPQEFSQTLQVGMRVHVPFGKANRLIQGIVLAIEEEEGFGLKELVEVLDFSPVLNEEQLWLADELRKTVFSYKISILKAMLPNFLNSSYDKILYPTEAMSLEERQEIFGEQASLRFSDLDKERQATFMRLSQLGRIRMEYQATDQKRIKTEKWYKVDHNFLVEMPISNRAKRKQDLKEYLLKQNEVQLLADLREKFSRELVQYFIDQNAIVVEEKEVSRTASYFERERKDQELELNSEQEHAVAAITEKIGQDANPILLEGITGSGKTEVYLQVIEQVLQKGKTAIMLVPEISLTPQMTDRFIARFGQQVAILHSGLSNGEKYDEWRKVERG